MRKWAFLIPLVCAGLVLAQPGPTADELIKKLGHEDFQAREDATKALIEMGEKAVPALEKAIHSEDVEVRLRAGRALRAIRRADVAEQADRPQPEPPAPVAPGTRASDVRIEMRDGKVRVKVKVVEDGQETLKEYEGESLDALKKEHPELKQYLGGMDVRVGVGKDPFDMDDFFKKWSKDWNDDFFRRWEKETKQDMERMRQWMRLLQDQRQRALGQWRQPGAAPAAPLLGVRATRPAGVLDAQLGLRGRGVVIEAVEKGSLAEHLGLQRYDILLELNGTAIRGTDDVARAMRAHKQGTPAEAKIIRAGKEETVKTER